MSKNILTTEWLNLLNDPYAILGISVNADERQISKRYHILAKDLHPDNYNSIHKTNQEEQELAQAVFARLINPAYSEVKHTQKRLSVISTLRLKSKSVDNEQAMGLQMSILQAMATMSAKEAELFYEEAIKSYAKAQYYSMYQSYQVTQQLSALNIIYLSCQQKDHQIIDSKKPIIDETQIITPTRISNTNHLNQANIIPNSINYAHRHYERALQYSKQEQWNLATSELRDAIKIEPGNSDYYALLGVVYMQQKFLGMAKVYIRQALKLNSQHALALKYARILEIEDNHQVNPQSVTKAISIASLLGKFLSK